MNLVFFVHLAMFVPFVAITGARVLFVLYALDLGASPFAVGLLATATQIFPLLLSYPAGVLQDRFGARWLLAAAACSGGIGISLPYFFPSLPVIYIACGFCGIWSAFVIVLTQALVGMLSGPTTLARNFSHYTLVAWSTQFFGPLVAGYSIDSVGYASTCLVLIPIALLAVFTMTVWGGHLPGGVRRTGQRPSLRGVLADREVLRVLAASGTVQLAMELFPFFVPLFGHALALQASTIGWLLGSSSMAAVLVCLMLPRLAARYSEERLLGVCFVGSAFAFSMLPLAPAAAWLAVVCILFGLGMGGGQALSTMLMYKRSTPGQPGAAMGLRMMTNSATRVAGPPLLGFIASVFGLAIAPWTTAAIMLGSAWLLRRTKGNQAR